MVAPCYSGTQNYIGIEPTLVGYGMKTTDIKVEQGDKIDK